jgi:hypothetical protein
MPTGRYRIALGYSAERIGPAVEVSLPVRSWPESGALAS